MSVYFDDTIEFVNGTVTIWMIVFYYTKNQAITITVGSRIPC